MNKRIISAVVAVIVVLGLAGYLVANQTSKKTTTTTTQPTPTPTVQQATQSSTSSQASASASASASHEVSYQGQDGKTALELLQQKYPDTQVSGTGTNAFVTSINGYTASTAKKEYWSFYVNGKASDVGAGSYTTKSTDTITWKIATY